MIIYIIDFITKNINKSYYLTIKGLNSMSKYGYCVIVPYFLGFKYDQTIIIDNG